jgi:hypothetical protein
MTQQQDQQTDDPKAAEFSEAGVRVAYRKILDLERRVEELEDAVDKPTSAMFGHAKVHESVSSTFFWLGLFALAGWIFYLLHLEQAL